MTLYEMTPSGPRPLSLAEAAHKVYLALRTARPGSHTITRLIGLRDLAHELTIEEALRKREARRALVARRGEGGADGPTWLDAALYQAYPGLREREIAALRSEAQGELWREVDDLLARLERFEYDAAGESEEYWRVVAMRDRIAAAHPTDRSESDE